MAPLGVKRPKSQGRSVEDIASMSPEDFAEVQGSAQRDYLRALLDVADHAEGLKRFQRAVAQMQQRQAKPLPFGGGQGVPGVPLGTVGGPPVRIGEGRLPVEGVLPDYMNAAAEGDFPTALDERRVLDPVINRHLARSYGGGLLTLGRDEPWEGDYRAGLPLGVPRPTVPGRLPIDTASLPPGARAGLPGIGTGAEGAVPGLAENGAPGQPATVARGEGDIDMALVLAGLGDAIKENLTLQGSRGAQGTAAETVLALQKGEREERRLKRLEEVEGRKEAMEMLKYRLDLSKFLAEAPKRQQEILEGFTKTAAAIAPAVALATPETRAVIQKGLETYAEQGGLPKQLAGLFLGQGEAALAAIPHLLPYVGPAGNLIMMNAPSLLKEGKFLETMREAAIPSIAYTVNKKVPGVLDALDRDPRYKGKEKPFALVVDLVAGEDRALRDFMAGTLGQKHDDYERFTKRLAGLGVEMPERTAEIEGKIAEQKAMLPGEIEKAEALKKIDQKYAGTEPLKETDIAGLRKEFTKESGEFLKVRDAFARIEAVAGAPTAAGDLALIFNYMKMLDPGSTVREGEFATAEQSAGVPARVRSFYNKLVSGERLAPEQRADFLSQSKNLFSTILRTHVRVTEKAFRDIATRRGANPQDVVPDLVGPHRALLSEKPTQARQAQAPPKAATIEQGRAELNRLMGAGLTREQAIEAMRKAGWK